MSGCVDEVDLCVIRGDGWSLDVGLSSSWSEVSENPTDYVANLVFREEQDDELAPYLTLTTTPEVNPDPLPDEVPIYLRFAASATETQSLPDWDIVAYCELVLQQAGGDQPRRLFNSAVDVHD